MKNLLSKLPDDDKNHILQ